MRLRAFLAWCVLPVLVFGVGTTAFVARSVESQHEEISRLVTAMDRTGAIRQANGWATSRTSTLLALGAFRSVPFELQTLAVSANLLRNQVDRPTLLTSLSTTGTANARALRKLETFGRVTPEVRGVLSPLPPIAVAALRRGDQGFLDSGPDVATLAWFQQETKWAQDAASAASKTLRKLGDDPPLWRDPTVDLVAGSLLVVAVALWVVGAWRMSVSTRAAQAELDAARACTEQLRERNADLRSLIGVARRVTAERGLAPFARALAAELRELVGGDVVTVMLLRDGRLEPFGGTGRIEVSLVDLGQGTGGRSDHRVRRRQRPGEPLRRRRAPRRGRRCALPGEARGP